MLTSTFSQAKLGKMAIRAVLYLPAARVLHVSLTSEKWNGLQSIKIDRGWRGPRQYRERREISFPANDGTDLTSIIL
jgi:hypothetical protein